MSLNRNLRFYYLTIYRLTLAISQRKSCYYEFCEQRFETLRFRACNWNLGLIYNKQIQGIEKRR